MLLCTWVQTVQRVLLFVPGCCVAAEWTEVRAPPRLLLTPRARCKRRQQASNRTGRWAVPSAYPTYWQAHFVTGLHPTCQWPFHLVTGACMWAAACIPLLLTQGGGVSPAHSCSHACVCMASASQLFAHDSSLPFLLNQLASVLKISCCCHPAAFPTATPAALCCTDVLDRR